MVDPAQSPRLLGIDDWAWRKGHGYGTILCDLERGKVIDLLPERSVQSTEEWLRTHPGEEVISRDRASLYAAMAHSFGANCMHADSQDSRVLSVTGSRSMTDLEIAETNHHRLLPRCFALRSERSLGWR